jgi:hypothetical protein
LLNGRAQGFMRTLPNCPVCESAEIHFDYSAPTTRSENRFPSLVRLAVQIVFSRLHESPADLGRTVGVLLQ